MLEGKLTIGRDCEHTDLLQRASMGHSTLVSSLTDQLSSRRARIERSNEYRKRKQLMNLACPVEYSSGGSAASSLRRKRSPNNSVNAISVRVPLPHESKDGQESSEGTETTCRFRMNEIQPKQVTNPALTPVPKRVIDTRTCRSRPLEV